MNQPYKCKRMINLHKVVEAGNVDNMSSHYKCRQHDSLQNVDTPLQMQRTYNTPLWTMTHLRKCRDDLRFYNNVEDDPTLKM